METKARDEVTDPLILVSLVPHVQNTLKCNYDQCWLVVTRLEPKGTISVVINGHEMNKKCDQMDTCIEKIAAHLGSTDNDPRRWWAARRERNTEIIDMYSKGMFCLKIFALSYSYLL